MCHSSNEVTLKCRARLISCGLIALLAAAKTHCKASSKGGISMAWWRGLRQGLLCCKACATHAAAGSAESAGPGRLLVPASRCDGLLLHMPSGSFRRTVRQIGRFVATSTGTFAVSIAALPCRWWQRGAHISTDTAAVHDPDTSGQGHQRSVEVKVGTTLCLLALVLTHAQGVCPYAQAERA